MKLVRRYLIRMTCTACWGSGWIIGTVTTHKTLCIWCLGKGTQWGLPSDDE